MDKSAIYKTKGFNWLEKTGSAIENMADFPLVKHLMGGAKFGALTTLLDQSTMDFLSKRNSKDNNNSWISDLINSISYGVAQTTSESGMQSMAMGALMGGAFGSVGIGDELAMRKDFKNRIANGIDFLKKSKDPIIQIPNSDIKYTYNDVISNYLQDINTFKNHSDAINNAINNGDKFEFLNNRHDALVDLVSHHIENGTLDFLKTQIKNLEFAGEDDLKNTFGGTNDQNLGGGDYRVIDRLKNLQNDIDEIQKMDSSIKRAFDFKYNITTDRKDWETNRIAQLTYLRQASSIRDINSRLSNISDKMANEGLPLFDINKYKDIVSPEDKLNHIKEYRQNYIDTLNSKLINNPSFLSKVDEYKSYGDDTLNLLHRKSLFEESWKSLFTPEGHNKLKEIILEQESKKPDASTIIDPSTLVDKNAEKEKSSKTLGEDNPDLSNTNITGYIQKMGEPGKDIPFTRLERKPDNTTDYHIENFDGTTSILNSKVHDVAETNGGNLSSQKASISNSKIKLNPDQLTSLNKFGFRRGVITQTGEETNNLLQRLMERPDWKNFIKAKATNKFSEANRVHDPKGDNSLFPLHKDKFGKIDLYGKRSSSSDISIELTDPNTGKTYDLFHLFNPDYYYQLDNKGNFNPLDISSLNPEQFNSYFSKFNGDSFKEQEIEDFKRLWNLSSDFYNKIKTLIDINGGKDVDITRYLEVKPRGQLDFKSIIDSDSIPISSIDIFKDCPILDITRRIDITPNAESKFINRPSSAKLNGGYYTEVLLPNGEHQLVRLMPRQLDVEKEFLPTLKDLQNQLSELDREGADKQEIDRLIANANIFIAARPDINISLGASKTQTGYKLDIRAKSDKGFTCTILDYNNTDNIESLLNKVNADLTNQFGFSLDANSFKQDFWRKLKQEGKDKFQPSEDHRNAFTSVVKDNIIVDGSYTLKFNLFPDRVAEDIGKTKIEPSEATSGLIEKNEFKEKPNESLNITKVGKFGYHEKDGKILCVDEKGEPLLDNNGKQVIFDNQFVAKFYLEQRGDTSGFEFKISSEVPTLNNLTFNKVKNEIDKILNIDIKLLDKNIPQEVKDILDRLNSKQIPIGLYFKNVIYLHENAGKYGFHEAFHAVMDNFLSDKDKVTYINTMEREMNLSKDQYEKEKNNLLELYPHLVGQSDSLIRDVFYTEKLADRYADWKYNNLTSPNKGFWSRLFERISNFVKTIFGSNKIQSLFDKIDSGVFKNSDIHSNKLDSSLEYPDYKLIPGLTASESQEIVYTLAGKIIRGGDINDLIKYYSSLYDPNNKKYSSLDEETFKKLIQYNVTFTDPKRVTLIKEQVDKLLNKYKRNEVEEDEEVEDEIGFKDRDYDKNSTEYDPFDKLSGQIKNQIATTLFEKEDKFGNIELMPVNVSRIYNKLLLLLSGKDRDDIFSIIQSNCKYDKELTAVFNNFKDLTGWDIKSKSPVGESGTIWHNAIVNHFASLTKTYNSATVFDPITNTSKVFNINQSDVGNETYNSWKNSYLSVKDSIDRNKGSYIEKLEHCLSLLKGVKSLLKGYGNMTELNQIKTILNEFGLDLEHSYLDYSFGDLFTKNEEEQNQYREDRTVNKDRVPITTEDIQNMIGIVKNERDLFNPDDGLFNLDKIASGNAWFRDDFIIPNYRNAEGKSIYSYTQCSMVSDMINNIKNKFTNKRNILSIKDGDYLSFNHLVDTKNVNKTIANFNSLQYSLGGDIREDGSLGVSYKHSDPKSMIITAFSLFNDKINSSKTDYRDFGRFINTIFSDKSQLPAITLPIHEYVDSTGNITQLAKDHLFSYFNQEYNRIAGKFEDDFTQNNKAKGKFILFPDFNNEKFLKNNNIDLTKDIREQRKSIDAALESIIDKEIANLYHDFLEPYKIIDDNNDLIYNENIRDKYKDSKNIVNSYLKDFYLNDFINSTGINQLLGGDLSITKGFTDWFKRNSRFIVSGPDYGSGDYKYININDTTELIDKDTLDIITDRYSEWKAIQTKIKEGKNLTDTEKQLNDKVASFVSNDGQCYSTIHSAKNDIAIQKGLTPEMEDVINRIIEPPIKDGKPVFPTEWEIRNSGLDLISQKQTTTGQNEDDNFIYHKMSVAYLTKQLTSKWDNTNKQWVPIKGREKLHYMREAMEHLSLQEDGSYKTIHMVPQSASKLHTSNIVDTNNLGTTPDEWNKHKVFSAPNSIRKLQVENATHYNSDIKLGIQLISLLDSELNKSSDRQVVRNKYNSLMADIRDKEFKIAANELVNEDGNLKDNITRFLNKLQKNTEDTGVDTQIQELLKDLNGKPEYGFNISHVSEKLESIFLKHFKRAFQIETSGRKCTILSHDGIKKIYDKNTGRIITDEEYFENPDKFNDESNYGLRELNIHKLSGDKIVPGEIMITKKQAELYGIKANEIINQDILKGIGIRIPTQSHHSMGYYKVVDFLPEYYGDTVVAPKQVVHLAGSDFDLDAMYLNLPYIHNRYGTPTKYEKDSFSDYKDWFFKYHPDIRSDLNKRLKNDPDYQYFIKNSQSTKGVDENLLMDQILGNKYRIDNKLYDKINKHEEECLKSFGLPSNSTEWQASENPQSWGAIHNDLLDTMNTIFESPELWDSMKTPASVTNIKKNLSKLDKLDHQDSFGDPDASPNGLFGKIKAYNDLISGKRDVGIAAQGGKVSAELSKHSIELNPKFAISVNIDGKPHWFNTFDLDKDNLRAKADNMSSTISMAVDNGKEPLESKLNLNSDTLSKFMVLKSLGIDKDGYIADLLARSPIMKEYTSELTNKNTLIRPDQHSKDRILSNLIGNLKYNLRTLGYSVDKKDYTLDIDSIEKYYNKSTNQVVTSDSILKEDKIGYLKTQLSILNTYKKLSAISDDVLKVGKLLSLYKSPGKSFKELSDIKEAINSLKDSKTIISEKLFENSSLNGVIDNINKLDNVSKELFLKSTNYFKETADIIKQSLNQKGNINVNVEKELLTFLQTKVAANSGYYHDIMKSCGIKDINDLHNLLYNRGLNNTSLANELQTLLKKYPDLQKNRLISSLKTIFGNSENNKTNIDLLSYNTKFKISNELNDLRRDSFVEGLINKNPEISNFFSKLLLYNLDKDNLGQRADSFTKLIPTTFFKDIANKQTELLKAFNDEDSDKILKLIGFTPDQLKIEFAKSLLVNSSKNRYIRNITGVLKQIDLDELGFNSREPLESLVYAASYSPQDASDPSDIDKVHSIYIRNANDPLRYDLIRSWPNLPNQSLYLDSWDNYRQLSKEVNFRKAEINYQDFGEYENNELPQSYSDPIQDEYNTIPENDDFEIPDNPTESNITSDQMEILKNNNIINDWDNIKDKWVLAKYTKEDWDKMSNEERNHIIKYCL